MEITDSTKIVNHSDVCSAYAVQSIMRAYINEIFKIAKELDSLANVPFIKYGDVGVNKIFSCLIDKLNNLHDELCEYSENKCTDLLAIRENEIKSYNAYLDRLANEKANQAIL